MRCASGTAAAAENAGPLSAKTKSVGGSTPSRPRPDGSYEVCLSQATRPAWFWRIPSASTRLVMGTPIPMGGVESLNRRHSAHLTS